MVDAIAHSAISFKGTACAPKCLPTSLFYFNIVQFFTSRCRCSWTIFVNLSLNPNSNLVISQNEHFLSKQKFQYLGNPQWYWSLILKHHKPNLQWQLSDKNENELLPLSDSSHCYLCTGHFHFGLQWQKFEDSFKVKSTKRIYNKIYNFATDFLQKLFKTKDRCQHKVSTYCFNSIM